MSRHTPSRLVILALLLASPAFADGPAAEARPADSGQPGQGIGWQPFTVESFHGKSLDGQAGSIDVPERRDLPAGETGQLALHFVRLPATAENPAAPIVYLDGGPGGSGIRIARVPGYFETFEALTAVADVILLDQRGTGKSDPGLSCAPPAGLPPLDLFAAAAKLERFLLERVAACRQELEARGVDLRAFTTRESADDLESLRRALGAPRLSLLGFSYGTHLGLSAVRRHGASLERVALVGVEGPDHTRKLPSSLDTQVRKLSLMAARDPAVGQLVPDMYALLGRILDRLAEKPLPVPLELPDGRIVEIPVGPHGLQMILNWDLGDGNDLPVFPALLATIDQGDPSLLAWFVRKRAPRLSGGVGAIYFAVDGASGASPERWARIARETPDAILGNVANGLFPEVATVFGVDPLDEGFRGPIVTEVEALFVSGSLDSNAPPYQAEEVRWGFTRSSHLVVENAGHEDMLVDAEVRAVLADFFRGRDVSERRVTLPPPRFLSIAEAKEQRLGRR